jgi:hypothetical protein
MEKLQENDLNELFTDYIEEQNFSPVEVKKSHKSPQKNKSNRKYHSYTNADKIEFLSLSEGIGSKQAAQRMKISWSTAKSWVKKDMTLREEKTTYAEVLKCN